MPPLTYVALENVSTSLGTRTLLSDVTVGITEGARIGVARGLFRSTVTARDIYLMIAAMGYFYLSNRYTLSAFLGERTDTPEAFARWEAFIIDAVRRAVAPPDVLPPRG